MYAPRVPYLGSTIFVATLVVALLLSMTGWFLVATALWPAFVARAAGATAERPVLTFLLGVPGTLALLFVSVALTSAPGGAARALGLLFAGAAIGFALTGAAGVALRVGRALPSPGDAEREWPRVLRAGVVLELAMLLPILGWFLVFPATVVLGVGAATMALRRTLPKDRAAPP